MKKSLLVLVAAVSAFALSGSVASAATLSPASSSVFGPNGHAQVTLVQKNKSNISVQAGGFSLTTDITNPGSTFVAWCLDIRHALKLPTNYNITANPFENTSGPIVSSLANIQALFNTGYNKVNMTNSVQSAGFQLALWELLYEDPKKGFNLFGGSFKATGISKNVLEFANKLLGGLGETVSQQFKLIFYESAVDKNGKQISQNLVSVTPVPLPAAGLMLGAGILGMFALKRLRRRDTAKV